MTPPAYIVGFVLTCLSLRCDISENSGFNDFVEFTRITYLNLNKLPQAIATHVSREHNTNDNNMSCPTSRHDHQDIIDMVMAAGWTEDSVGSFFFALT